jgi:hypothetical protein
MAIVSYLALFFSGAFIANGVPHFVRGISGEKFQSPFASPRGVGESSPVVNLVWGFTNLAVGFVLLSVRPPQELEWIVFGAGVLLTGLMLSRHFGRVRGNSP